MLFLEVEQRYEVKSIIGHGAYGTVCSGVDLKTGKQCAIKKIENIFEHRSLAKRTLRENSNFLDTSSTKTFWELIE